MKEPTSDVSGALAVAGGTPPSAPALEAGSPEHTPRAARSRFFSREAAARARSADNRLIVRVRFAVSLVLVATVATDPVPLRLLSLQSLVVLYGVYAAALLVIEWHRPDWVVRRARLLHGIDLTWAIAATTVSGGAMSHVFPFFLFVLATAALGWGMAHTLADAAVILLVAAAQSALMVYGVVPWEFARDVFVVQASLVVGLAVLFAVIAEREHALRLQSRAIADLVGTVSRAPRLGLALELTLARVVDVFGASRVLLVLRESETSAVSLWRADARPDGGIAVDSTPLSGEEIQAWLPAAATGSVMACEMRRRTAGEGPATVSAALDSRGTPIDATCDLPAALLAVSAWKVLLAARASGGGFWTGQLYVLDPTSWPHGERRLGVLERLTAQVVPALLTLFLLRRLRERPESIERSHVSKELHSGVLQTLAALEIRLELLRRQAVKVAPALVPDLVEVRGLLHDEAIEIRELMLRLRSSRVDAERLPGDLADLVERFGRTSEIDAGFVWGVDRLALSPRQCSQVVRLVQEALFNARRHSGATRVLVRVQADATAWGLVIEDNGRGLGFDGHLLHEQLMTLERGPRDLGTRVAALGGTLDVRSSSAGATLEMTFPWPALT
ncbi:MAG TPA: histidine kinase [Vicinamibacterales bacterium]|nr:histidine kinase [Vicinamibacterales bacterium]